MNYELWGALALIVILAGIVGYQYFAHQKPAIAKAKASVDRLEQSVAATAKADVEKAASLVRSKLHPTFLHPAAPTAPVQTLAEMAGADAAKFGAPTQHGDMLVIDRLPNPAAPAGVADVTPPASAALAGGGGTTLVVTASDAVLAKHAQLDTVIATHQAAIVDAQAQKATLTAAQDALNKLVA